MKEKEMWNKNVYFADLMKKIYLNREKEKQDKESERDCYYLFIPINPSKRERKNTFVLGVIERSKNIYIYMHIMKTKKNKKGSLEQLDIYLMDTI